jgi:hypothetical protein
LKGPVRFERREAPIATANRSNLCDGRRSADGLAAQALSVPDGLHYSCPEGDPL